MSETTEELNKLAKGLEAYSNTIEKLLGEIDEMDAELDATLIRLNNE